MFSIFGNLLPLLGKIFLAGCILGVVFLVQRMKKTGVQQTEETKEYKLITFLFIGITAMSFLFTMGWIRVALIVSGIFLIHTLFFLFVNLSAAFLVPAFPRLKIWIWLSGVTCFLPYWILPDAGDVGGAYLYFELITDEKILDVLMILAPAVFFVNLLILTAEVIAVCRCKGRLRAANGAADEESSVAAE